VPEHPGLATQEPTARLSATKSIAMQCFSLSRRVSATHEQDARAGSPGRVKAARVSLALADPLGINVSAASSVKQLGLGEAGSCVSTRNDHERSNF